ncbi:hypothetical protein ACFP9V_23960 [Deinococcus radiopugnans]|uniref:DNA-binding transcriptional MerR regulator n=1 Tax=Deinococcus radiopugnans ATCC 19172 TaxID=585398 RepID=A0A5C4XI51_9DEIO|nr:hypothetical protein [Deinococcus radiopugnans]MBB6018842.1 DNA-binding transcriptional MerR regulator [Deinococcus radiopugnans ATCC 19172]TNM63205.1 hypothetical protein FHR04_20155 [Deinococcus radiopugnans ATCC 19172]
MTAGERLTAGQVGERLGVKVGMVRRYALALEAVAGISLEVDPIRGRLYPVAAVELLEVTRAHLLTHPGLSVEAAMKAVTGQSEGSEAAPVRVPGVLTSREDLAELLREALAPALAPIMAELTSSREEIEELRRELAAAREEIGETRGQLARLEVTTHAALPPVTADSPPTGLRGLIVRLLGY